MTANPFGCRFHHHGSTVFYGAEKITTGTESVVHDQGYVVFFCYLRDSIKIGDVQIRITDGFKINGFGIGINQFFKCFRLIAFSESYLNTQAFKLHLELIVSTPVKVRSRYEIVARLHKIIDGDKLG